MTKKSKEVTNDTEKTHLVNKPGLIALINNIIPIYSVILNLKHYT
jgi:hypothetical protein